MSKMFKSSSVWQQDPGIQTFISVGLHTLQVEMGTRRKQVTLKLKSQKQDVELFNLTCTYV